MQDLELQFITAYDSFAESIYQHCFFRVFRKSRAEEILQETFLRFWVYLRQGEKIENPRALLYKIANNLIIDDSRKKKEQSLDKILETEENFDPASSDHENLEKLILVKSILEELKILEEADRNLIIMRFVDDLDPKEIALILGISANNVSVKINRALKIIKEKFK